MQYWNPQFALAKITTDNIVRSVRVIATEIDGKFVTVKFKDHSDNQEKTEKILLNQLELS